METTKPKQTPNSYDAYIGEIQMVAFDFAPAGWELCDGKILLISQNTALFQLIGTKYGGDGRSTFALPDMRGRVPVCFGQGPGLTNRKLAEIAGNETVTLSVREMPSHTHQHNAANNATKTSPNPDGLFLGISAGNFFTSPPGPPVTNKLLPMNPEVNSVAGSSQPHNNMQPFLSLNFIICTEGIYPQKNNV